MQRLIRKILLFYMEIRPGFISLKIKMNNAKGFFLFIIILLSVSCKTQKGKYPYAIRDFRDTLQPLLLNIVSKNIVNYYDSTLRKTITDKELIQLSQSELPVLRGWAFREILFSESFNHIDIIMNHLDDTAIAGFDYGEFGTRYSTISDEILNYFEWEDIKIKNKVIDEVITKHNYLKSAYTILYKIEPQERYYAIIKNMATRNRNYDYENGFEKGFEDIEIALYGLAKFKKKEDITIIKQSLLSNCWQMSASSFRLMQEFPDSSYMEVYEDFYPGKYYNTHFSSIERKTSFISSIAVYKNNRSAKIIEAILNNPPNNCPALPPMIKQELVNAIWNNPCAAYLKLRKQIERNKSEYKNYKAQPIYHAPVDSSAGTVPKDVLFW
jgi:hypothetical protein